MKIGVVDADLISRKKHRFPNLACLKISGYHKSRGDEVNLLTSYGVIDNYDKVYISKVFTDTPVPKEILEKENVQYGGTGFFFDEAPPLPYEIEHHFPDYHLYDEFVNSMIAKGTKRSEFSEYLDYSIGYTTRGCFRKCDFCVNRRYDRVFKHSPLEEFYDSSRPKICLLDDNFFGGPAWRDILSELIATGKPFKFKQGLDERLLTDDKFEMLCSAKYDGSITFAFDDIGDYRIIEKKLQMVRRHTDKQFTFYVLCGFDREDNWNDEFWRQDIIDVFRRIELLARYRCIPYIMRFNRYKDSPYKGIYITLARWCNQPAFFKKLSFTEYAANDAKHGGKAATRYIKEFADKHPDVAEMYFNKRFWEVNKK